MNYRPKVTIEDLLKLKRAERPGAEFWQNFERDLRQKQLTALMQKRSWWQDLPQLLTRRGYVPAGAMAILAFTLVTVKYSPETMVGEAAPLALQPVSAPAATVPIMTTVSVQPVSSPLVNRKDQGTLPIDDRVAITARTLPLTAQSEPGRLVEESRERLTPSARSIAANLARLEQSEPELLNAVMGNRLSAPEKSTVRAVAAAEFASLPSAGSKRSRLLAHYNDRQVIPVAASPDIVRERLSRRLGDADYNDRLTRVGLKGDQVSLKF